MLSSVAPKVLLLNCPLKWKVKAQGFYAFSMILPQKNHFVAYIALSTRSDYWDRG